MDDVIYRRVNFEKSHEVTAAAIEASVAAASSHIELSTIKQRDMTKKIKFNVMLLVFEFVIIVP